MRCRVEVRVFPWSRFPSSRSRSPGLSEVTRVLPPLRRRTRRSGDLGAPLLPREGLLVLCGPRWEGRGRQGPLASPGDGGAAASGESARALRRRGWGVGGGSVWRSAPLGGGRGAGRGGPGAARRRGRPPGSTSFRFQTPPRFRRREGPPGLHREGVVRKGGSGCVSARTAGARARVS